MTLLRLDDQTIARGTPERMLLLAVVVQAVEDAMRGDAEALAWLERDACRAILGVLMTSAETNEEVEAMQRALVRKAREGR
jgi:hypothetical protein